MPRLVKLLILFLMVLAPFVNAEPQPARLAEVSKVETRCGWYSNPTPANVSLLDREAEWIIGVQGGYQAEGDWPDIPPKQWVETNVHYGYGCACMRLTVNRETSEVIKIVSSSARPLSACRRDKALKKWGFK